MFSELASREGGLPGTWGSLTCVLDSAVRPASSETRTKEKEKGENRRISPAVRSVEAFQGNVGGTPVKRLAVRSF